MIPLRVPGANTICTAPPGNAEVRSLHVLQAEGCCISRWEPTPAELQRLVDGGSVELWVMGQQPPVYLKAVVYGSDVVGAA
jgi:hypothetical protein